MIWGVAITATLMVVAFLVAWWIMVRMPGRSYHGPLEPDETLGSLTAALRRDVERLAVEIGERNVVRRPAALQAAANEIASQLKAKGYETRRQSYMVSNVPCENIEAERVGAIKPAEIVVIGAHYDTVFETGGANDNTSGVAAMLALARAFAERKPDRTLRFVAFVNEEPPYFQSDLMGSRVYARRCRERNENVVAMLSLETMGCYSDEPGSQNYPSMIKSLYPSEGNFIGFVANLKSRDLLNTVIATFRAHEKFPSEGASLPADFPGVGYSDHWSFWQEGYPALMVTDTAMYRYPHYHTPEDTIDKIDFERLARVVRGLNTVVEKLVTIDERQ